MTFFGPESDWHSSFGNRIGVPLADLFLYHFAHLMNFVDGGADYEIPTLCFNIEDTHATPLLGWQTTTGPTALRPSFTMSFLPASASLATA